jgi:CRISPR-associated exonuclease Cas4
MKMQMVYPSDIASYALCPEIVYNRKVLGIHSKSTSGQALGLFEHETRRRFYTLVQNHIDMCANAKADMEFFGSIATQSVEEALPYVILNYGFPCSTQKFKQNIISRLARESSRISERFASGEGIELTVPFAVEVSLRSPKLRMAGRIDCLLNTVEGPIPVDFKTYGKHVEALPHELQIAAYAMLMEETYNSEVNHGLILYTEDDFARIVSVTPKHRMMVTDTVNSILEMLETGKPPDSTYSLMSCTLCDFSRICRKGD